jgi:hypothetical protein
MSKLFVLLSLCCVVGASVVASGNDRLQEPESKYKVGQQWNYHSRPGEEASYFVVVKIEHDAKLGKIVHIAMQRLKIKNRRSPDGVSENVNHMPFAEEAINKSEPKLLKEKVELPSFEEGYRVWRKAFDEGNAGIYTISLAEAVDVMEAALNH